MQLPEALGNCTSAPVEISLKLHLNHNHQPICLCSAAAKMASDANEMTHDDIWDDSALVNSWNQALEEYQVSQTRKASSEISYAEIFIRNTIASTPAVSNLKIQTFPSMSIAMSDERFSIISAYGITPVQWSSGDF